MSWLQLRSVAGHTATLPSEALRSANSKVLGSGQGSVSTPGIVQELPESTRQIKLGRVVVNPVAFLLGEVE